MISVVREEIPSQCYSQRLKNLPGQRCVQCALQAPGSQPLGDTAKGVRVLTISLQVIRIIFYEISVSRRQNNKVDFDFEFLYSQPRF